MNLMISICFPHLGQGGAGQTPCRIDQIDRIDQIGQQSHQCPVGEGNVEVAVKQVPLAPKILQKVGKTPWKTNGFMRTYGNMITILDDGSI